MTENKSLKILVGLDLSEMDQYLIDYMKTLNQIFTIHEVVFLHNIKLGELPRDLLSENQLDRIQKKITDKLTNKVQETALPFSFRIKVTMENLSEIAFEKIGKVEDFDLLVMGNKQELKGNGALPYKLLRLFPAPALIVPETFKTPIKTIVEAITFSKYTKHVLTWAAHFKSSEKDPEIKHHAVNISKVFYYPLMTDKEADKTTEEDIARKKKKWHKEYNEYGNIDIVKAEGRSVPNALITYAQDKKADIIILGVKSNSIIRDLMVGSVANELFTRASDMALLFVKSQRKAQ